MTRARTLADLGSASLATDAELAAEVATVPRRNFLINGAFTVWQRGDSFANTIDRYTADRWFVYRETGNTGKSVSRGGSLIAGERSSLKMKRDSGNTSTTALVLVQALTTDASYPLQGKTVTVSFTAKKGADFSGSGDQLTVMLGTGEGVDQAPNAAWSNFVNTSETVTLSGTAQRYSVTFSVSSTATQVRLLFLHYPTGTAGADDAFWISNVQLEIGDSASTFEFRSFENEYADCAYYFERYAANNGFYYFPQASIPNDVPNRGEIALLYRVKRTPPVITVSAASDFIVQGIAQNYNQAATSFGTFVGTNKAATNLFFGCPATLNAFTGCYVVAANIDAYIDISAEL